MELTLPSWIDGLSVDRDLRSGHYRVRGFGVDTTLQVWTFGERRRLLEACLDPLGFNDARFLAEFNRLVYTPVPPNGLQALFAHLALYLFGIDDRPVLSRDQADRWLAYELGVLPSHSDKEPAPELDRLIRGSIARPAHADTPSYEPDSGWTRIEVDGG